MFGPQSESLLQGACTHPRVGVLASHSAGGHDPSSVHGKAMHSPLSLTTSQVNPLLQSVSCAQSIAAAALRAASETTSTAATERVERMAPRRRFMVKLLVGAHR